MTTPKITLGKAIDQIVDALSTLDKKEQQTVISTVCSFLDLTRLALVPCLLKSHLQHHRVR